MGIGKSITSHDNGEKSSERFAASAYNIISIGDSILLRWDGKGSYPEIKGTLLEKSPTGLLILVQESGGDKYQQSAIWFRKSDGYSNPYIGYRLPKELTLNEMAVIKKPKVNTETKRVVGRPKSTPIAEKENPVPVKRGPGRPRLSEEKSEERDISPNRGRGRTSARVARPPMKITSFPDAPGKGIMELKLSAAGYLRFSDMVFFKISPKKRESEPERANFVDQWRGAADLGSIVEVRLNKAAASYLMSILVDVKDEIKRVGGRGSGPYNRTIEKIANAITEKFGIKPPKALFSPEGTSPVSTRKSPAKEEEETPKRSPGRPKKVVEEDEEDNLPRQTIVKRPVGRPKKNVESVSSSSGKKTVTEHSKISSPKLVAKTKIKRG